MIGEIKVIDSNDIVAEVQGKKNDGWRFITMTCCEETEGLDFLYHFDKNLAMNHLRIKTGKGKSIPSVSNVYFAALVVENEIQDFYDVKFDGLAIDYKGKFVITDKDDLGKPCTFRQDLSTPAARIEVVQRGEATGGGKKNG